MFELLIARIRFKPLCNYLGLFCTFDCALLLKKPSILLWFTMVANILWSLGVVMLDYCAQHMWSPACLELCCLHVLIILLAGVLFVNFIHVVMRPIHNVLVHVPF